MEQEFVDSSGGVTYLDQGVSLTPGSVSVTKTYANDCVQLWTIDASTKYYEVFYVSHEPSYFEIALTCNENTLKSNETLENPTIIRVETSPVNSWRVFSYHTYARYNVSFTLYKYKDFLDIDT